MNLALIGAVDRSAGVRRDDPIVDRLRVGDLRRHNHRVGARRDLLRRRALSVVGRGAVLERDRGRRTVRIGGSLQCQEPCHARRTGIRCALGGLEHLHRRRRDRIRISDCDGGECDREDQRHVDR